MSCDKTEDPEVESPTGMISGKVIHHEFPIPDATIYIKAGATEFPGVDPENYEKNVISDSQANYEFTGLAKGNYYLFSVGFDSDCYCDVIGGIPLTLDSNSSHIEVDIPVTE